MPDLSMLRHTELILGGEASGRSRYASSPLLKKTLFVHGVDADTINYLGSPVRHPATLSEVLSICRTWEPSKVSNTDYVGGGSLLDTYVKTLVCGNVVEDQPQDAGSAFTGKKCTLAFESLDCLLQSVSKDYKTIDYGDTMLRDLRGRVFGTSSRGYVGVFPAAAQIGDQICIVLGSNRPFLLRHQPDKKGYYKLVGECYVAGLMNGEALLGPLPELWQYGTVDNHGNRFYVFDGRTSTLEDPRRGPLPPGWRICYEGGEEIDEQGNLSNRWFENEETGEKTWADPRLTKEALVERGIDMKDLILI